MSVVGVGDAQPRFDDRERHQDRHEDEDRAGKPRPTWTWGDGGHGSLQDIRSSAGSVALIALIAFAIRVVAIVLIPNEQFSDSVWYEGAARNLVAGFGYGFREERAWFPPGYSHVLAILYAVFGPHDIVGKLANATFAALTSLATIAFGMRLFSRRVGLIAGLIVALWPNDVLHALILSTEPLTELLWALALVLIVRGRGAQMSIVIGLVIAIAVLTRPVSVILVAVWALAEAMKGARPRDLARRLALGSLVVVALVAMWTVRNVAVMGEPILISTNGGYNFWQVNNEYADGTDFFWSRVPPGLPEYELMRSADEVAKNDLGYRWGLKFMRDHPDRFVWLAPRKVAELWRTDTSAVYEALLYPPLSSASAFVSALRSADLLPRGSAVTYYVVVGTAALFGAVTLFGQRRRDVWLLLAPLVLLTAFHLFFHAKDRFHVPAYPMIALLAAVTLDRLIRPRPGPILVRR